MFKHLKYLRYVLLHKWFVMIECFRHGLYFRGIVHDMSKFRPSEWFKYAEYFYGKTNNKETFNEAWLLHQNRNNHHWQWWILVQDDGFSKILKMDKKATLEMLCDWYGASQAQRGDGWQGAINWYKKNYYKMRFHPDTRLFIREFLKNKGWDGKI